MSSHDVDRDENQLESQPRQVSFHVRHEFDVPAEVVWDELIDWEAHAEWIPLTHVVVDGGDATSVGATFTAYTGISKLALVDRMEIAECSWNADAEHGRCVVDKHGPVLFGQAGFDVVPTERGSAVDWFEHVDVRWLPRFFAPVASALGSTGFRQGMKRLDKVLAERTS